MHDGHVGGVHIAPQKPELRDKRATYTKQIAITIGARILPMNLVARLSPKGAK